MSEEDEEEEEEEEEEEPQQRQRRGGAKQKKQRQKNGLSLRQIKAIGRQAVRLDKFQRCERNEAARDIWILGGGDNDGDY